MLNDIDYSDDDRKLASLQRALNEARALLKDLYVICQIHDSTIESLEQELDESKVLIEDLKSQLNSGIIIICDDESVREKVIASNL